eukprot:scaffold20118_cov19-Tisochrysis_lutea.AAC.5
MTAELISSRMLEVWGCQQGPDTGPVWSDLHVHWLGQGWVTVGVQRNEVLEGRLQRGALVVDQE